MLDWEVKNWVFDEEKRRAFVEIADAVRELGVDVRHATWLIDANNDNLASLVVRMKKVTGQLLRGTPYHFDEPESVPALQLEMAVRRHFFLLYKEMLHNVGRHASASFVEATITYKAGLFTMQVKDDGVGFNTETVKEGRGMTTLRRRAAELGTSPHIESKPGEGTCILITVEIPYRHDGKGWRAFIKITQVLT